MMKTSTLSKTVLVLAFLLGSVTAVSANHYDSPNLAFDTGFDFPEYESHAEILTLFVAPFIFVTLLLQMTLQVVFQKTVAKDTGRGKDPNVKKISTMMALAITGMLVPSPFWDYIILAGNSIGVIAVSILLFVFILIFSWVGKGSRNTRRYGE